MERLKEIYFDNNATTRVRKEVVMAMEPYFYTIYGNASSLHQLGQRAKKALEDSRAIVAGLLGAKKSSELVFTSCGTESNNTAIKGVSFANKKQGNHIITTSIEHHAVLNPCEYLSKEHGFEITYLPVDRTGMISTAEMERSIKDETILISVMHANNEIGTLLPINKIAGKLRGVNEKRVKKNLPKIYFHTDAVQTVGKLPLNAANLGVDLLSFSAHKFYGPKGIGGLYIKEDVVFDRLLHGGHHESGQRAGTENVAGIVGIAKALELSVGEINEENEKLLRLRKKLEAGILKKVPYTKINGHATERLAGTVSVTFEFIEGESLLIMLDMQGIAFSTGSACASGSTEPSHVIKAIGVEPACASGTVRFSLGRYNTAKEVEYLLEVLPPAVEKLRSISPLYKK